MFVSAHYAMRVVVVGAGVVGLASAVALARRGCSVIVLEKETRPGTGISSRNSEVIHAGIYYEPGSLKARLCVAGKAQLYEYLQRRDLPCAQCGKLIVAHSESEVRQLEALAQRGADNGVTDLRLLTRAEVQHLEPGITAAAGLLSPSTGILSVHDFMHSLDAALQSYGGMVVTHTRVVGADHGPAPWQVHVADAEGSEIVEADAVINSAGLHADDVAAKVMDLTPDLRLSWTKGNYFSLRRSVPRVSRLVYPCPEERGLGVHLTLDLGGGLRLGPDVEELSEKVENYQVDAARAERFLAAARRYMPALVREDLAPAYSGIRGQRTMPGWRDFYIAEESARGAPGWINLIGIDSPGLTASLAIGDYVAELVLDEGDLCASRC